MIMPDELRDAILKLKGELAEVIEPPAVWILKRINAALKWIDRKLQRKETP